jgi:hypothetical protein
MTRARRTFDRADLRRAALADLHSRLESLRAQRRPVGRPRKESNLDTTGVPQPPSTAAARKTQAKALAHQIKAIEAEIAVRLATGGPSKPLHTGRKRPTKCDSPAPKV